MKTVFVLCLMFVLCACDQKQFFGSPPRHIETQPARFKKVDEFVFVRDEFSTTMGIVYEDTKTGIQYLYLWGGMANGGPAITRLWE